MNRCKYFNGKANDIHCLGVCLFISCIGGQPFLSANLNDKSFTKIINGQMLELLKKWKKDHLVNDNIMELFHGFFQFEDKRISIKQIKNSKFFRV